MKRLADAMEDRVVDGAAARLVELKRRVEEQLVRQLLVGRKEAPPVSRKLNTGEPINVLPGAVLNGRVYLLCSELPWYGPC
jgi:hypothetical protein